MNLALRSEEPAINDHYVSANPYGWPFDGDLRPQNTALIIIDMQTDFCGPGGYVDKMGYDLSLTRAPIEPIRCVLAAMRKSGYSIIHTREGHRPDLSDLPANKRWRSRKMKGGIGIGDAGPRGRVLVRGEPARVGGGERAAGKTPHHPTPPPPPTPTNHKKKKRGEKVFFFPPRPRS